MFEDESEICSACIDDYMNPDDENFCESKFSKEALGVPSSFPYDDSNLIGICEKGQSYRKSER